MKTKYMLLLALVLPLLNFAQIQVQPQSAVTTGILYDLAIPVSGIERFDGGEDAAVNSTGNWYQVYFELSKADLTNRIFPDMATVRELAKEKADAGIIPLGLIFCRYNHLGESAGQYLEGDLLDVAGVKIPEKRVFTSAALKTKTYRGSDVTFRLDRELIFSNTENTPEKYLIGFEENQPFQEFMPGQGIRHSFAAIGLKTIRVQAVFAEGTVMHSAFYLEVVRLETPEPTFTWTFESDIPYQGATTTGDAFILLAEGHDQLTRPIIICEGIDFEDNFGWPELYEIFNQQNLLEDLRAEGFDAVVLNFHEPLTHIQRNAMLMTKLIGMVNDSVNSRSPITVVGPSMGGLVTRYALSYMENNAMEHNTALYIAFETPNQGANMPLGLQYALYFFKDMDANIQMLLDILNEPAPKQMLAYHYTEPPSATAGSDPLFGEFQNDLETIGDYPQNLRKIALSNGRGDGTGQPYNAGDQVIQYEYSSFLATLKGNAWAVENNSSGQIFEGLINSIFYPNQQLNVTVFSEKPYDNAPGGSRSTFADIDTIQAPFGDIIALQDNHCFVPTVSALDIDEESLFHNLAADPQIMQKTPFDTIYWSAENYDHTFISAETEAVILSEVLATLPEVQVVQLVPGWNDLSGYVDPTNKSVENLTSALDDHLIIMQDLEGVYWPAGGINTLGNWNYEKGYMIKLAAADSLVFEGQIPDDKTLQISAGWNLIPVMSSQTQSVSELFSGNLSDVEIIKEAVGYKLYWPLFGISTLNTLLPGRAYLVKASRDFEVVFSR